MICPYCKIDFAMYPWAAGTKKTVCWNCRNYADAAKSRAREEQEAELFKTYKAIHINWDEYDSWRTEKTLKK